MQSKDPSTPQRSRAHSLLPLISIGSLIVFGLCGVIAPLCGIVLLVYMKRLASHRVDVHDNGFSYYYAGVTDICLWTDLEKINEVLTEEQLKVLKVPGAVIKNTDRSFIIRRKDGKDFDFTVNSIDSIPRLAKYLEQASAKFGIPWERITQ
tara:strand:- start:148 stop:600 length:453 start_codon:yes stop_codon:yes gene_type:complete